MTNINRDYFVILDVKSGELSGSTQMYFYNTDKNTSNIYVQLVVRETPVDATPIENATNYIVEAKIVKPGPVTKDLTATLVNESEAIYEFDLPNDCTNLSGSYKIEFWVKAKVADKDELITSSKAKYKVKKSILTDLDEAIEDSTDYPLLLQLMEEVRVINNTAHELDTTIRTLQSDMIEANNEMKVNEEQRQANEVIRETNEVTRITQENARQEYLNTFDGKWEEYKTNTTNDITDYKESINTDISNFKSTTSNDIANYKSQIDAQEVIRETNEEQRKANEQRRIANENERKTAENQRKANEEVRVTNENERKANEASRVSAENARVANEEERKANEANREAAEDIRKANEQARITEHEAMRTEHEQTMTAVNEVKAENAVLMENDKKVSDRMTQVEISDKRQYVIMEGLMNSAGDGYLKIEDTGNDTTLYNSVEGFVDVKNITGNTMVNSIKNPDDEFTLNADINTAGQSVTLTTAVDNGQVDVLAEGNTMVNVCDQQEAVAITTDTNTFPLRYLYTSTEYTLQFESDTAVTIDITLGGYTLSSQNIVIGLNKINIITPNELTDNNLILNGTGFSVSNIVVTEATDKDFGYFSGMKSVGELEENKIEILSSNKNLWDMNEIISKLPKRSYSVNGDNLIIENAGACHIPLFKNKFKNNTQYTLSYNFANEDKGVTRFYFVTIYTDGEAKYHYIGGSGNGTFTTLSNKTLSCIKISYGSGNKPTTFSNIILTEGVNAVNYIPHAENKKQILLNKPLRAVGDTKDRFVQIDGKWYVERKCTERNYETDDETNTSYKTDKIKTVYTLPSPTYEPVEIAPTVNTYTDVTHITNNSTIPMNMPIVNSGYELIAKPSTKYTVVGIDNGRIGDSTIVNGTITTPATITDNFLRPYGTGKTRKVMLLEGEPANIPGYFKGIKSVFEDKVTEDGKYAVEVKVVGKNKLNPDYLAREILESQTINGVQITYNADGTITLNGTCTENTWLFSFIDISKYLTNGKTYIVSGLYMAITNKDGSSQYNEFVMSEKVEKVEIYLQMLSGDEFNNIILKPQLEEGTVATEYEPYKETKQTLYLDEPLYNTNNITIYNDKLGYWKNYDTRDYQDGDFGTYLTDMTKTVYQLAEPVFIPLIDNCPNWIIGSWDNCSIHFDSIIPLKDTRYRYTGNVPSVVAMSDEVATNSAVSDEQDNLIVDLATQVAVLEMMTL